MLDNEEDFPDYILNPIKNAIVRKNLLKKCDLLNYSDKTIMNNLLAIPMVFQNRVVFDFEVGSIDCAMRVAGYPKNKSNIHNLTPEETLRLLSDLNHRTYFHIRNIVVSDLKRLYAEEPERNVDHCRRWYGIVDLFENPDTVVMEYLERNMYEGDWYLRGIADISYQIRVQNNMPILNKFTPLFKTFDMVNVEITDI